MRGAKLFQSLLYHWAPFLMREIVDLADRVDAGGLVERAGEAIDVQKVRR